MKYTLRRSRYILPKGWTLVELLIAMALSLLIIAAVGQIYLAAKHSYNIQNSISKIQDVGRFTTEVLTDDIRQAGYWGLLNMDYSTLTGNVTPDDTCVAGNTSWGSMVQERIFGLDDLSAVNPPPGSYSCINGSYYQGDVLAVRYGNPSTATPFTAITTNDDSLYIRTTSFTGTIALGTPSTTPVPLPVPPPPHPPIFDYKLVARVYYVRNNAVTADCGNTKISVPELARKELDSSGFPSSAQGLVTGVEWLEFQYGVDTNGHGVNKYLNANDVDTWNPGAFGEGIKSLVID